MERRQSGKERLRLGAGEFAAICKQEDLVLQKWPHFFTDEAGPNGTVVPVIRIVNVDVHGVVRLENLEVGTQAFHFENVRFDNFLIVDCKMGHINFTKGCVLQDLELSGETTRVEYLKVAGSRVDSVSVYHQARCTVLTLENNIGEPDIVIQDERTETGYLKLLGAKVGMLELSKGAKLSELDVDRSMLRYIKLHENAVTDNIQLTNHSECLYLELRTVTVNETLKITDSRVNYFWLQVKAMSEGNITGSFIQTLKFKTLASVVLNLVDCHIFEFSLQRIKTGKDGLIQLINCGVNTLEFDTVLNLTSVNIRNIYALKTYEGYQYYPGDGNTAVVEDWYEPKNLDRKAQINIFDSDIGKVMFSSDLSSFDKFSFSNSKIIEIFIAGPKLPEVVTRPDEDSDEQRRIAYNQIKRIYENRGDNITAMKYSRLEMEIYRRQLSEGKEDRIPGERFQLFFNHFTNRHGTEWQTPLLLTLTISILMYSVYCVLLFGIDLSGSFRWTLIPYYFEFLNPAHKTDFIKRFEFEKNTTKMNIALIVDAICRIFVPLLLFQMVQAFRKYSKK